MFGRSLRVSALFLCWVPIAVAQGQDSPQLARALERAEQFYVAIGPKPQPTAKWLRGDRFAYAPDGKAPWTIVEASTMRVVESEGTDAAVGGPGPAVGPPSPGMAYFGPAAPRAANPGDWTAQSANGALVVSDPGGATRLQLPGAPNYGWVMAPNAWSRDRQFFVAIRRDVREIHSVPIVDYSTALERVTYAPYPKTGTPLPVEELHMVDPAEGVARPVRLDTRDASIWFLGWRRTVSEAVVMRMSRTGKRLDLFAILPSGATRLLAHDERPETFVAALDFTTADWPQQVTPLPDESGFLWMSERDGWRHVYLYGYDGAMKKQVTSGAFPVHRVVRVDSSRREIYVVASADSSRPYDRHVYRVGLDGTGFTALTSAPGQHTPTFSPAGDFFLDAYSSLAQPHTVELRRADGTLMKSLGQAATAQLEAVGYKPPEPFRVKASDGSADLYGVLYRPRDFDAARRYPVVDYIYAGPFTAVHQTTHAVTSSMQGIPASLAEMGFVVVVLDARGTPGRGKAFQDANYGRIGQIEIPDHVAAIRELAQSRPFMDTTRAGIVGHSWGGYFALRGMLTAPDFFTVGYAGAPGDLTEAASINEPNMGLLSSNRAGYDAGSNVGRASALRGRLKIMHGTSDVMAPLSTTMRMVQALIEANKSVDLLIMPGQPHGPAGAAGRYYREDVRRYLATHLLADDARGTGRSVEAAIAR